MEVTNALINYTPRRTMSDNADSLHSRSHEIIQGPQGVDDISLKITQGEVVGLLGPNGRAKPQRFTSSWTDSPDSGQVQLDGVTLRISPCTSRKRRHQLPPSRALHFPQTHVEENNGCLGDRPEGDRRRERLEELIEIWVFSRSTELWLPALRRREAAGGNCRSL